MDFTQIITLIIGGGGVLGFGATIYQTRKSSSAEEAHTEVEAAAQKSADWAEFSTRIQAHMDYQDKQIQALRAEVKDLQEDRTYDREHIRILQKQIRLQLPPPPMKPGDVFPEDQVGG